MLLLLVILLIQVPAVQHKLVNKATSWLSNKTHSEVKVSEISLSLTGKIVCKGIYFADLKKDTLLSAGEISIDIALIPLISKEIRLRQVEMDNIFINLKREPGSEDFNYQFIADAFSDSTKVKEEKDTAGVKWKIALKTFDLSNFRFNYSDAKGGSFVRSSMKTLALSMDAIDLDKSKFDADKIVIDGLIAAVEMRGGYKEKKEDSGKPSPVFTAKNIVLRSSTFSYGDSVSQTSLRAFINRFGLDKLDLDLEQQKVVCSEIRLERSDIRFALLRSVVVDTLLPDTAKESKPWTVSVKNVDLKDNSLAYDKKYMADLQRSFSADHLHYQHISLSAKQLSYDTAAVRAEIASFTAKDLKGFELRQFETQFAMTQHSVSLKKLKVRTKQSHIDSDLALHYESLASLKDSIANLGIDARLGDVSISVADILFFSPTLFGKPMFRTPDNVIVIKGSIKGAVSDLAVNALNIRTGGSTVITGDFAARGLPDANAMEITTDNLHVESGSADLAMILGKIIPSTISVPPHFVVDGSFRGKMKEFVTKMKLKSSYGNIAAEGSIDRNENFEGQIDIASFDLGQLLKNRKTFGPVTMTASAEGHGLSKQTIQAKVMVDGKSIFLNQYAYQKLTVRGNITGEQFEGSVRLADKNVDLRFDGLVNNSKDNSAYKFKLDLGGADLRALHLTEDDMRIGMVAVADLRGNNVRDINGKAGITKIVIGHEGKKYILDSLLFASINESNKSELNVSSAVIGLKYNGTFSPIDLAKELRTFINSYFKTDTVITAGAPQDQQFSFELQLKNHPVLSEVFFPQLKSFDPGLISGSFNSKEHQLTLNAQIRDLTYGTTELKNFNLAVSSDAEALRYNITTDQISGSRAGLENLVIDGRLQDQQMITAISSTSDEKVRKIALTTNIRQQENEYRLHIDPASFFLQDKNWTLPEDNYIAFGKKGLLFHNFSLKNNSSELGIVSVHDKYNDDLQISVRSFELRDFSKIVEKDTSLVEGQMTADILLQKVKDAYGIVADGKLENLKIQSVPVGNIALKAKNVSATMYDLGLTLSGNDNDLKLSGTLDPADKKDALNLVLDIGSLNMKSVEAATMGNIADAKGFLKAHLDIDGAMAAPELNGDVTFRDVSFIPKALNTRLTMRDEKIEIKPDLVKFNDFTVMDERNQPLEINGSVAMHEFKDLKFDLLVTARDFTLMDVPAKGDDVYYGKMIIDSKIKVTGNQELPVVNANLRLKKGTNFTFAVPEKKITTDRGEGVVIFIDSASFNPIITRNETKEKSKGGIRGLDVQSTVEVDKEATLRLLMDPTSSDSLVVRGDAALSLAIDPSGKTSITGAYNLNDGSYLVSLEAIVKRKFAIEPGSTIVWNGDPMDAEVNINAIYSIRTSPIDLVADQVSGLSEADKNGYKQRFPFLVFLKLRGELLHPDISFEIQLPPEEKGILGGAVNAKLNMLNEDPSSLNKQVFALLVLGRFVQEDPLQTETNAMANAARTTVSKFLSAQLNQLSQKALPGVELSFDIQSYDDYSTGQAEGRTEVDIGLKKQLFNDRLEVQVGGSVDVEGERAKQNNASDITSDVTLEYKLTKDGRYRIKGFRHNQYEGALDGQLVETGGGVMYIRDFDKWKEFFTAPKRKKDQDEIYKDSINSK